MKRLLLACGFLVSVAAVAFWFVRLRPIHRSFYSDAEAIRAPVDHAPLRDILWQPAVPVPGSDTEDVDQYEPRLSADGSTLFFVRGRAGENADLYVADRQGAGWGEPRPLDAVNSDADDLGPELSADGETLYLYSNRDGGLGGYDLWRSQRTPDGWSAPAPLPSPINSPYNDYGPALAPDGRTLYFASNRPPDLVASDAVNASSTDRWPATLREDLTTRTYDLYASAVTLDGIQTPTPLASLNTPFNEGAPAISAFGDFLYFASDRPGGRGGFDLYRARRIRGDLRPPENLGDAVNTSANELDPALALGGYRLYFSSDRALPDAPAPDARRYALFMSTSREVFRDLEIEHRPPIAWAALWQDLAPWLLLLLLALLGLLTLLALIKTFRERRVSLLTKCLLGSLLAHLALMFLFTLWNVTASIAEGIRTGGEIRISLGAGAAVDVLFAQLQGRATDAAPPPAEWRSLRPDQPTVRLDAPPILKGSLATVSLAIVDAEPTTPPPAAASPRARLAQTPALDVPDRAAIVAVHASPGPAPLAVDEPALAPPTPDRSAAPRAPLAEHPRSSPPPETVARPVPSIVTSLDTPPIETRPADTLESPSQRARVTSPRKQAPDPTELPTHPAPPVDALRTAAIDPPKQTEEPSAERSLAALPMTPATPRPRVGARDAAANTRTLDITENPLPPPTVSLETPVLAAQASAPPMESPPRRPSVNRRVPSMDPTPSILAAAAVPADFSLPPPEPASSPATPEKSVSIPPPDPTARFVPSFGTLSPARDVPSFAAHPAVEVTTLGGIPETDPAAAMPLLVPDASPERAAASPPPVAPPIVDVGAPALPLRQDAAESLTRRTDAPMPLRDTEKALSLPPPADTFAGLAMRYDPVSAHRDPFPPRITDTAVPPTTSRDSELTAVDVPVVPFAVFASSITDRRSTSRRSALEEAKLAPTIPPATNVDLRGPEPPPEPKPVDAATNVSRPAPRDRGSTDAPIGTIFGRVTDADSGAPLPRSIVRLDRLDAAAVTATADERGEYSLVVPAVPDDFALSVSRTGYAPAASNVQAAALENRRLEVNFALRKRSDDVVVTEAAPELHHMGDDVFDGDINSQFQKSSEGNGFETRFDLSERQVAPYVQRAEVRMLIKGVQRKHGLFVNGTLLSKRLSKAPRDGGFGEFTAPIDPALLRAGENTFRILCAPPVDGDFDDFEFVNVQIHLALGAH